MNSSRFRQEANLDERNQRSLSHACLPVPVGRRSGTLSCVRRSSTDFQFSNVFFTPCARTRCSIFAPAFSASAVPIRWHSFECSQGLQFCHIFTQTPTLNHEFGSRSGPCGSNFPRYGLYIADFATLCTREQPKICHFKRLIQVNGPFPCRATIPPGATEYFPVF